jgi:hypothetical protein
MTLLKKLSDRIAFLSMNNFDFATMAEEAMALQKVNPQSFEECREITMGTLMILSKAMQENIAEHVKYVELIDTHATYVKALEARCGDLLQDLKNHGGSASDYPLIPKPEI